MKIITQKHLAIQYNEGGIIGNASDGCICGGDKYFYYKL